MTTANPPMSELFLGGDWASAHADLGTLAHDAELLAFCVAEPLRRELLDVARLCRQDDARAAARWSEVRVALRAELAIDELALRAAP